jgi:5-methylcytosine-specific restriction endonuclease McrA
MITLSDLSDDVLVGRLVQIRKEERSLLVELLRHLAELDRRKTVLALGFPSLFSFCTDHLGLTKASAFRRTTAARLLGRFPLVAEYLADGRLNLTTLVELRDVLDEAHLVEILNRAAGRTEEQVKELVAALRPQEAPPDLLRRLPTERNHSSGSGPQLPGATPPLAPQPEPTAVASTAAPTPPPPAPPRAPVARLEPIAPERHVLRVTVGAAFVADLEALREALSHRVPGGGLEEVLHECMRVTLRSIERQRHGTGKKTMAKEPPPGSRYVPVAVRDEVWRRDGGQCAFVGTGGRRCSSRHQLQLHHLDPFGLGGPSSAQNLALRCRAHNLHAAEQDYGRQHIDRKIAAARLRGDRPSAVVCGATGTLSSRL